MPEKLNNKKIVVFESLDGVLTPFVWGYLARHCRVFYIKADSRLENSPWFKKNVASGKIQKIPVDSIGFETSFLPHNLSLDNVEKVYAELLAKSRFIALMFRLLNSETVALSYKKALLMKLYPVYNLRMILKENAVLLGINDSVNFVPVDSFGFRHAEEWIFNADILIHIPFWALALSFIRSAVNKIKALAYFFGLPIRILVRLRKIEGAAQASESYQVGIRSYLTDVAFHYRYRSIDFLLNERDLNKHNTLFCVETVISDDYQEKLKEKQYHFVRIHKILNELSWGFIRNIVLKKFLPYWLRLAFFSLAEDELVINATTKNLLVYLRWSRFLEKYRIKHFVVYNNTELEHIVRNILFSQAGVETWYYAHSCNFADLCIPGSKDIKGRHVVLGYLYYDNFVSWGKWVEKFFSSHPNHIKRFVNLGVLWSEHITLIRKKENENSLLHKVNKKIARPFDKIIGVFDTTFWGATPLQIEDIKEFIHGIVRLLDELAGTVVILKTKRENKEMFRIIPQAESIYQKLYTHRSCYIPGKEERDASETIAISDLVISACFTSSSIEALCAGKKAIYFDANNKFAGCYYDRFPRFVAHSYVELKELARYWLYEANPENFDQYLKSYIGNELDPFMDGQAITRFRRLLCNQGV